MNIETRKAEIRRNFRKATEDITEIGASILEGQAIRADLGARTPKELIREATLAYSWINPTSTKSTPVGKPFHTAIHQTFDALDKDGVLPEEERNILLKQTGSDFIRSRKLGPTLNELGELNLRQRMVP